MSSLLVVNLTLVKMVLSVVLLIRCWKTFILIIAFMGVVGLDLEEDAVYTYMANDGVTKHVVMKQSKLTYMLVDHEKFSQIGNYKYARVEEFTGLITDHALGKAHRKLCQKYGIEVLD